MLLGRNLLGGTQRRAFLRVERPPFCLACFVWFEALDFFDGFDTVRTVCLSSVFHTLCKLKHHA